MIDCNLDYCPFACEGYVRKCIYTKDEAQQMPPSKEIEYILEHFWDGE